MPADMRAALILLCIAAMVGRTSAQCFLLDSASTCTVCWKTTYTSHSDKVGVTTVSECPAGVTETWDVPPPKKMIARISYPVAWSVKFNLTDFPVLRSGSGPDSKHIPHANIHSCITSRGVCSPFVSNSPGLATHTKALESDITISGSEGNVAFTTHVSLTEEVYTIIAHVRFYVPNPLSTPNASLPDVKYDIAIGASRSIQPQSTLCDPGSVYNVTTDSCSMCPAGTHLDGAQCTACAKGTYAPVQGLSSCIPCEEGYTDEEGQTVCKACPKNTQRRPSSAGVSNKECLCIIGSYAKNGVGEECLECPSGGYCPGGIARPYPKTGFWGDRSCEFLPEFGNSTCPGFDTFIECNPPSDCKGGVDFSCSEGHSGPLCKQAQPGWFIVGGAFWFECGDTGHLVGVVGIFAVVLVWLTINKIASGNYDAMDIALLFVQITGMISTFGLKWHANLSLVNTALGIANFDVDFVTPLCLGKWTGVDSFYVQLFLPAIYAVGCFIYYGLIYVWGRYVVRNSCTTMEEWRVELTVNLINKPASLLIVMYHTLCLKCFQSFSCEALPDGRQFMKFSPDIECWQGSHIGMVVMSSIYIPTVLVGFPAYLVYVIRKAADNETLHTPSVMDKFSFAFSRYDPGYKWWEAVLIFRRFAIALISVAFDTSLLQAALTIVLLVVLLTWHTHTRPFVSDQIDNLEVFTICGSIFYALAGMLFYPSITADAQGYICTDDQHSACSNELSLKNAISIVLLTWIIVTLVYAFWTSYLCVIEVNRTSKANKMMRNMLGILKEQASSFRIPFPVESSLSSFSWRRNPGTSFSGKTESDIHERSAKSVTSHASEEEEAGVSASNTKAGGSACNTLDSVAQFKNNFAAAWELSSNRMTLDDLVQGKDMLRWAREVKKMKIADKRKCLIDFEQVTLGLLSLERDVTHYAETQYADICRHIASHEGVIDYLSGCPDEERNALAEFMEGYASYMTERSEMTNREKGMSPFPYGSICLPENMSVIVSYLVNSTTEDVARLSNVLRDISGLKEGRQMVAAPSVTPPRMSRMASFGNVLKNMSGPKERRQMVAAPSVTMGDGSFFKKGNAVAPLPRDEGSGSSATGPTVASGPESGIASEDGVQAMDTATTPESSLDSPVQRREGLFLAA